MSLPQLRDVPGIPMALYLEIMALPPLHPDLVGIEINPNP